MSIVSPAKRLIVAADYDPDVYGGRKQVKEEILDLAHVLGPTGVCFKINSAVRAIGLDLADDLQSEGLDVFIDWKLVDIKETLDTDAKFLNEVSPKYLTAMCNANVSALTTLKKTLKRTLLLGVTVPTTWDAADCMRVYNCNKDAAVLQLMRVGIQANVDGFICAPKEAPYVKSFSKRLVITPGVRFADEVVQNDDQNPERVMEPQDAIRAGADALVMGRPIIKSKIRSPLEATHKALAGIEAAFN
jgi:orotidine-5'-phosphate decarboxylase